MTSARVIGMGNIGKRYAHSLIQLGVWPLYGKSVATSKSQKDLDFDVFLEQQTTAGPPVDLAVIATRTGRHATDIREQESRASRIFVEKPLAASLADVDLIPGPIRDRIIVASPLRSMEGFARMEQRLEDVGEIRDVNVRCLSWLPDWIPGQDFRQSYSVDPQQGGVLRDLIHEVDYCLTLFGMPVSLSASLSTSNDLEVSVDTRAFLSWQYESFPLTMTLDFASRITDRSIRVQGSKGSMTWDIGRGAVQIHKFSRRSQEMLHSNLDVNRDELMKKEMRLVLKNKSDYRLSTFEEGHRALFMCELAAQSHQLSSQFVPVVWEI